MEKIKGTSKSFKAGLEKLGFEGDNALFFTDKTKNLPEPEIAFHIETAKFIHKEDKIEVEIERKVKIKIEGYIKAETKGVSKGDQEINANS